jgi:hypothetical protein
MHVERLLLGAAAAALLGTTSACGGASDDDVASVARAFYTAIGSQDGAAACRLLAPPTRSEVESSSGQPCAEAIVDENLQPSAGAPRVQVYATMALVRWSQETTFVTRYDAGWRVYAAGCSPDPSSSPDADRYDCNVQGG